ncbi:MAG TPA: radical SAM protein [Syntrophorhabdaceae bacterium]|nr:radical SAM protein [Syntrophorhabdaceae bacterium]HOL06445.1 radical SAM protein [Syntrophorhabdaceae bacterium]HON85947.1 radical SAM protein [Syntrophorhabdaceae bacterium]HOT43176.1 radical SAM protein [Syntrophorhabdaceae bacterium]HPP42455.1 radical SAM protein [Syntrophorhabdaceae bacterium]
MNRSLRYEIGPIRPPNEAYSLLVRFTRNCPWNQCAFCHTYKGRRFEKRKLDEIKRDIDTIRSIYDDIMETSWKTGLAGRITEGLADSILSNSAYNECYKSVLIWAYFGGKNVFIQDANSLAMNPDTMAEALKYLKERLPTVERITSYARSRTIAKRLKVEELIKLKEAGLTRLHIGLESGSNFLLRYINKGVTKEEHIEGGRKVKESGIELSEYVVLGLGGKKWWVEHATETADALNKIDPDFIRFRTLKVLRDMPLYEKVESGDFLISHEEEILREEKMLIEGLSGITSTIKSDHILNLLEEVDGRLPEEKEKILGVIDRFFSLSEEQRLVFRFGRRAGIYRYLDDLNDELTYYRLKKNIREMESKEPGSVEKTLSLLLENYI